MHSCWILHLKSYALLISKHRRRPFSSALCPLYHIDVHICKGDSSVSIMISPWTVRRSNSAFTPCTSICSGPNLGPTQSPFLQVPQRFSAGVKQLKLNQTLHDDALPRIAKDVHISPSPHAPSQCCA